MENKIAIIGGLDSFMGFKALGVDVKEPDKGTTIPDLIGEFSPQKYSILFIEEQFAHGHIEEINKRNTETEQAVIVIPGTGKYAGIAGDRMRQLVRKAVGAEIV